MTITIYLGIFFLAAFAFLEFQKEWNSLGGRWRKAILNSPAREEQFLVLVSQKILWVLSWASWTAAVRETFASWKSLPMKKRSHWLMLVLSPLALWPQILFLLGLFKINFFMLMGLAFFFWLAGHALVFFKSFSQSNNNPGALNWVRLLQELGRLLFFAGLFWLAIDLGLKNSALLQQWTFENGLAFVLADGRLQNLLVIVLAALMIVLITGQSVWALPLALMLVPIQLLSVNGAIALFLGEALGCGLRMFFDFRNQKLLHINQFKLWFLVLILGLIFGFMVFGYEKESLIVFSEGLSNDLDGKVFIILSGLGLMWIPALLATVILGHLSYKK